MAKPCAFSERTREDIYFAAKDRELLEKLKAKLKKASGDRATQPVQCPKCPDHLESYEFMGFMLDQCRNCEGIWLDKGELEAILKAVSPNSQRADGDSFLISMGFNDTTLRGEPNRRTDMLTVADVMTTDPISLGPEDTVGQAEEIMFTNKIRQLPIVDGAELVGIATDRDIRSFLSGRLFGTPEERETALNTKIAAVMSTEPITLSPDDDLSDAVDTLIEEKIGGIPVVDEHKGLVGIVTYVDVLRRFLDMLNESC
ncbi:MAG: CBS domain-containing protein [Candidatus Binatia bacterium]